MNKQQIEEFEDYMQETIEWYLHEYHFDQNYTVKKSEMGKMPITKTLYYLAKLEKEQ